MTSYIFYCAWLIATLMLAIPMARIAAALAGVLERRHGCEAELAGWRKQLARTVLLLVALALATCQWGGLYVFTDPAGAMWDFDGHGWPLVHPMTIAQAATMAGPTQVAVYCIGLAVDGLVFVVLLVATRHVLARWLSPAAFGLTRRQMTKHELPGWLASLGLVLVAERSMARPATLPGTEMIVYTTLLYEPWYVHGAVLVGLASLVFVLGLGAARGCTAVWRLRQEGVL